MKYIFTAAAIVFFIACQPKKTEETASGTDEVKQLKEEVMALHDEVMPKMGELRTLSKQLQVIADSLYSLNDTMLADGYSKAAKDLVEANEGMMIWMRQFEHDKQGEADELIKYFTEQREKVEKVNKDMKRELKEGQALID